MVPRTFIGPLSLAAIASPVVALLHLAGASKLWGLLAVRSALAILVWLPLRQLRAQISLKFGEQTGRCYVAVLCCQFHFLFYSSRTLPNIFALVLVLWAYVQLLKDQWRHVVFLLASATAIFRCDVLVLAGPVGLLALCTGELGVVDGFVWSLQAVAASLLLSFVLDSYMWQRPLGNGLRIDHG